MSMRIFFSGLLIILFTSLLTGESKDPVRARNGMVVSASELASEVGIEILKKGGNAVDAAVAVGFALAVTHPSAGNLGGGGFMVISLSDGKQTTIDYRERAPEAAHKNLYIDENGEYNPKLSTEGMTASGVPGSVAGMLYALEKYGTIELREVIEPAINLAEKGFNLNYRLANFINAYNKDFSKYPSSKKIFTLNGSPFEEEFLFVQRDLAKTLSLISEKGKDGFYKGETADLIVRQAKEQGAYITYKDLAAYFPVERKPLYGNYRDYQIMAMGPPSSGGIALIQTLNVLENFKFEKNDFGGSEYIHKVTETFKHVFADRSKHVGDEDFYPVPKEWLLSKEYAKEIFDSISEEAVPSKKINPGTDLSYESGETTHYSVVDKFGNAVSTTTTINSSFGNKVVVEGAGFLMNNEMDDFSAKPGEPNQFGLLGSEANSIEPGKRMLSSMTPTIVLKDGEPVLVIGSPGGSMIITTVIQVVMNCLEFGMDIQQAVDMPRFHHQWFPDSLHFERFGVTSDVLEKLESIGHLIGKNRTIGRAQGIIIDQKKNLLWGAADPRSFGKAIGY